MSSPSERLAFSLDETSVDPSARSSITPTQSLDSIVRGRALSVGTAGLDQGLHHRRLRVHQDHHTPDLRRSGTGGANAPTLTGPGKLRGKWQAQVRRKGIAPRAQSLGPKQIPIVAGLLPFDRAKPNWLSSGWFQSGTSARKANMPPDGNGIARGRSAGLGSPTKP